MSKRNLQYLIGKLKVWVFWQINQKCENPSINVAIFKSVLELFFASPFSITVFQNKSSRVFLNDIFSRGCGGA